MPTGTYTRRPFGRRSDHQQQTITIQSPGRVGGKYLPGDMILFDSRSFPLLRQVSWKIRPKSAIPLEE